MAKKYSQEFKHQAVQLILEEGKTVAQAAHELRLHENTLYRWVTEVKKAYRRQRPQDEVLHHSDRGSQYASHEYQERLKKYGMKGSMSRKGNCYDNACIESFHSILKKELVYLETFSTRAEAKKRIFEYIACFYNGKRIHSSIGYVTPNQCERTYRKTA